MDTFFIDPEFLADALDDLISEMDEIPLSDEDLSLVVVFGDDDVTF